VNIAEKPQHSSAIKFLTGSLMGEVVSLDRPTLTIGSDPGNDIVIKNDPSIAPFHVRLFWQNSALYIEKHPQAGKVRINRRHVEQGVIPLDALIELGEDICCLLTATEVPNDRSPGNIPFSPNQRADQTEIASLSLPGVPRLEISNNVSGSKDIYPLNKAVVNIGRSSKNEIVINHQSVSAQHLQIIQQGNQLVLIHPHPDRQQTLNGLLYQGKKIRGEESFRKVLKPGDFFRIGNENGSFVTLTFNDGSGKSQALPPPPVQPIKLDSQEISIGRSADNLVMLSHQQVSAHHALLRREGGTYRILDLNSTNHVYVNSQATTSELLKLGDEIRIGPYKLVFESTQLKEYDESNNIRIDALNLKRYGNNNVVLLNDISLSIEPHKFVAIVGGSGAGKSTLMKALSGLQPANEGKVLYNGQDYYRNLAAFNTQLGYVPQDDIVHRDLTVERALYYAAKMRLPNDFTEEQIKQRIIEVLDDVELTGKQKLLIKSLSGGQRKRASIALELLANPSLFFLDEPTSGLDPGLDRKMMFLLRNLADKGHTIILVTHATNNISTCDYVCFLAAGGHLTYFGPPDEALTYFGKDDFAEIYSTLEPTDENRAVPQEAGARFKTSLPYQTYVAQPLQQVASGGGPISANKGKRPKRGNAWKQFSLLCQRQTELLRNNMSNLAILLLQAPLIALVLMLLVRFEIGSGIFNSDQVVRCAPQIVTSTGALAIPHAKPDSTQTIDCSAVQSFLKDNPQGQKYAHANGGDNQALQNFIVKGGGSSGDAQRVIFLVGFFAVLFGCINGTREIVKETAIYQRERTVNLGILPYLLSKITVLGLMALFQAASILVIVQLFEPFTTSVFLPPLLEIYITLALVAVAGVMLGLVVSALAPNDDTANSLLPIIIIPQVIFAGSIIPMKDWITQVLGALFPTRWGLAALGSTLGLHADKIDGGTLFGNDPTYHGTLFSIYTQTDAIHRVEISWAALALTIVVLGIIIAIALKQKDTRA
jgi:ABC transport system ATP-binding/permease protein